jgi:DNA-3-methyladenine glycosylase
VEPDRLLASGPGRLTQAFGIDRRLDAQPMRRSGVVILAREPVDTVVDVSLRIGITKAIDWPLRFTERGSRWTSR